MGMYGLDLTALMNAGLQSPTQDLLDEKMAGGLGDTLRAVFGDVQGVAHQPFVRAGGGSFERAYYTNPDPASETDSIYVANVGSLPYLIDETLAHEHAHSAAKKDFIGQLKQYGPDPQSEQTAVAFATALTALRNFASHGTSMKDEAKKAADIHNSRPRRAGYEADPDAVYEAMKLYDERLNPDERGLKDLLFGSDFRSQRRP